VLNERSIADYGQVSEQLYVGKQIFIGATDGAPIYRASHVFKGHIDKAFKKGGLNEQGLPTPPTLVSFHGQTKDARFKEMFESLGDINRLCFEQSQIIEVCLVHRDKLSTSGFSITFFLFKKGEKANKDRSNVFVAGVFFYSNEELAVFSHRYMMGGKWETIYKHRIVIPDIKVMQKLL
jgi:hypothetical protein